MKKLVNILIAIIVTTSVVSSSQAQTLFSEKVGGISGASFMLPSTRFDVLSTESITRIGVQHGRRIENIEIEYTNGQNISQVESAGNDAGDWSYIDLEKGEYIIYITGRAGSLIDQLTFYTSMRRTFGPYGGTGGRDFEINIPANAKVIGFTGKTGPSIQQIGLIYKTPDVTNDSGPTSGLVVRDQRTNISTNKSTSERKIRDHRTNEVDPNSNQDSVGIMATDILHKLAAVSHLQAQSASSKLDDLAEDEKKEETKESRTPNRVIKYNGKGINFRKIIKKEQQMKGGTTKIRNQRTNN